VFEEKYKIMETNVSLIPEEEFTKPPEEEKIASKTLSIYEYVALIQARANQLKTTTPLVNPQEYNYDNVLIAEAEIRARLPRLVLCRHVGDVVEYWRLADLFLPDE
jgi:DNA-directed RNA polymerase subunit K/omega